MSSSRFPWVKLYALPFCRTMLECSIAAGWVAQSVEQRTENPCVGGSIPPPATSLRSERSGERRLPRRSTKCEGGPTPARQHTLRATTRQAGKMKFIYVYILQSETNDGGFYVGSTEDLQTRLKKHNAGEVPYTAKFRPWRIKTAIAFTEHERAIEFERYLKSSSGRAFARKRL